MPELPEVETVRLTLAPILGYRVDRVSVGALPLHQRAVDGAAIRAALDGRVIEDVRRWGKFLFVDGRGARDAVLVHLGMTGRLRVMRPDEPTVPHTHLVVALRRGRARRELRFSDPRRFGMLSTVRRGAEREHPSLAALGVDPLVDTLPEDLLWRAAKKTRRALKTLLLDQSVIAGIGNIYASEALWEARIRPTLRAQRLSRPRAARLTTAVVAVLRRALDHGGTSLRDFVAADGASGENAHYLRVYDREGARCPRRGCSGTIRRSVIQGRATFHCPSCQDR